MGADYGAPIALSKKRPVLPLLYHSDMQISTEIEKKGCITAYRFQSLFLSER